MITSLDQLDLNGTYSYADYLKWQFEERVELIKGKLFKMSPAPSRRHQEISSILQGKIFNFLDIKTCKIYPAPFDVRLAPRRGEKTDKIYTVVQPDLCVFCGKANLDDRGAIGAPDWVIEILSPGNSRIEVKNKFGVYEENGVKEYWLVDPAYETIMVYVLNEFGKFIGLPIVTIEDSITSHVFPGFNIAVSTIFEE
ncbi:Uma2 family endonuclease [Persicitalea sp.]|uniref:Uma2 family endonuclease n=1 Tax=Persicitalea sp. TaxID=3100273 RepID=UPI003593AC42